MDSMLRPTKVVARAPGKVNVCFRVGATQKDGSHAVATLYQAVSVFDTITATHATDFSVSVSGAFDCTGVPVDDRNLAIRAAKLLARSTGYDGGATLAIHKDIPRGTGMSGGSADAAATLLACNELWGTELDRTELQRLALELGADVPFALEGGTAVGTGRGDEFSQALSTGTYHWVIARAHTSLDEDTVVEKLDEHRLTHRSQLAAVPRAPTVDPETLQAVRSGCATTLAEVMHNDLQVASLKLVPEAVQLLEFGEIHGALAGVTLAASPSIAFLVENAQEANTLQFSFLREGIEAFTTRGPITGARVISST